LIRAVLWEKETKFLFCVFTGLFGAAQYITDDKFQALFLAFEFDMNKRKILNLKTTSRVTLYNILGYPGLSLVSLLLDSQIWLDTFHLDSLEPLDNSNFAHIFFRIIVATSLKQVSMDILCLPLLFWIIVSTGCKIAEQIRMMEMKIKR